MIVLATGFETSSYLSGHRRDRDRRRKLHDRWGLDPRAYLGVAVSGFPNFFMLYGPNTNQGANSIIYILEAGARLVASAVSRLAAAAGSSMCVRGRKPIQRADLPPSLERTIWTRCDSYYRSPTGRIVTQWPRSRTLTMRRRRGGCGRRDWILHGQVIAEAVANSAARTDSSKAAFSLERP